MAEILNVFSVKSKRLAECTSQDKPEFHEQFLRLFTANEAAIRAYVRRLVPMRDDAADVTQGVSLVLWKKLDELEGFRRWAFGVARCETLAWLQDKTRDRLVLTDDVLEKDRVGGTREAVVGPTRGAGELLGTALYQRLHRMRVRLRECTRRALQAEGLL